MSNNRNERPKSAASNLLMRIYGDLYLLFPSLINFLYKIHYLTIFKSSKVYLDKPASSFKKIHIGRNSSSSNIIRVINFSPGTTEITIKSYTRFGENCYFMLNSRHSPKFVSTHMNRLFIKEHDEKEEELYLSKRQDKAASIVIGNDVWIGTDVKIMGSRIIGDGAVIATGAVVTKNVEPYEIVGGVPAKHIGYRFDKGVREKLLKIKWWDWNEHEIKKAIKDFYNPELFVKKHK